MQDKLKSENSAIAKAAAGYAAAELIESGMRVGIGTGSTVFYFIERLAMRVAQGLRITAVTTSERSRTLANQGGIPLIDESKAVALDIAVDGADEIDEAHNMIKGGGGALTREKIVASMAKELVIIVDRAKCVKHLGNAKLPVEVLPFCWQATKQHIEALGLSCIRREDKQPFITDNNNYILDIHTGAPIDHPEQLDRTLQAIPGVVETGIFLGLAGRVLVGEADGTVSTF